MAGKLGLASHIELILFEIGEDLLGALDNLTRESGQPGDFDTVALARTPWDNLAEEDDPSICFRDGDLVVLNTRPQFGQFGQFMIVGGKDGP